MAEWPGPVDAARRHDLVINNQDLVAPAGSAWPAPLGGLLLLLERRVRTAGPLEANQPILQLAKIIFAGLDHFPLAATDGDHCADLRHHREGHPFAYAI